MLFDHPTLNEHYSSQYTSSLAVVQIIYMSSVTLEMKVLVYTAHLEQLETPKIMIYYPEYSSPSEGESESRRFRGWSF